MRLLALRTVLMATDLDSASAVAVEAARSLASAAGAALHVVHVTPEGPTPDALDAVDAFLRRSGVHTAVRHTHLLDGDPAQVIRLLADRLQADVIVLGPHREQARSDRGRSLGSTALAVVTESFAPCLVAVAPLRVPLERVLVAVDRSDAARGALVVGLSWASALRAPRTAARSAGESTMMVVHVNRRPDAGPGEGATRDGAEPLAAELARIRAEAGPWAHVAIEDFTLASNDIAGAILGAAGERMADLIVLGTRGLGLGRTGRLGSVSASLVSTSRIPLLLVPPALWVTHVEAEGQLAAG